jgi:hypothetical protein
MVPLLAGCQLPVPKYDYCGMGGAGSVTTLEIGSDAADGSEPPFTPWHDGDTAKVVKGGQGAAMIVTRLRATGTSVPECIPVEMNVPDAMQPDFPIAELQNAFNFYGDDSSRTSHAIYMPGDWGQIKSIQLTATALGASASVALTLDH